MPDIEDEPIIEEEPILEDEPVIEEESEPAPEPEPTFGITREQWEAQQQELADLRAKVGQPAAPITPPENPKTAREILKSEVDQLEARGQYVSDEWKQDRLLEIHSERTKQEFIQGVAPLFRKTLERELVEDASEGVQVAVPVIQTALREGKVSPQDLQNPQIAEWARKAAQFDAAATPQKPFPSAAPVGGVQPTAGIRARLNPTQKQELAAWEADLGMKYSDDMIKEGFNLA